MEFCPLFVQIGTKPIALQRIREILEERDDDAMYNAIHSIIQMNSDGEDISSLIVPIIRNISQSTDKRLKKALHMLWPMIKLTDEMGEALPEALLICNSLMNDLQSANEYIVASALRCIGHMDASCILEQTAPIVAKCCNHEDERVRTEAAWCLAAASQRCNIIAENDNGTRKEAALEAYNSQQSSYGNIYTLKNLLSQSERDSSLPSSLVRGWAIAETHLDKLSISCPNIGKNGSNTSSNNDQENENGQQKKNKKAKSKKANRDSDLNSEGKDNNSLIVSPTVTCIEALTTVAIHLIHEIQNKFGNYYADIKDESIMNEIKGLANDLIFITKNILRIPNMIKKSNVQRGPAFLTPSQTESQLSILSSCAYAIGRIQNALKIAVQSLPISAYEADFETNVENCDLTNSTSLSTILRILDNKCLLKCAECHACIVTGDMSSLSTWNNNNNNNTNEKSNKKLLIDKNNNDDFNDEDMGLTTDDIPDALRISSLEALSHIIRNSVSDSSNGKEKDISRTTTTTATTNNNNSNNNNKSYFIDLLGLKSNKILINTVSKILVSGIIGGSNFQIPDKTALNANNSISSNQSGVGSQQMLILRQLQNALQYHHGSSETQHHYSTDFNALHYCGLTYEELYIHMSQFMIGMETYGNSNRNGTRHFGSNIIGNKNGDKSQKIIFVMQEQKQVDNQLLDSLSNFLNMLIESYKTTIAKGATSSRNTPTIIDGEVVGEDGNTKLLLIDSLCSILSSLALSCNRSANSMCNCYSDNRQGSMKFFDSGKSEETKHTTASLLIMHKVLKMLEKFIKTLMTTEFSTSYGKNQNIKNNITEKYNILFPVIHTLGCCMILLLSAITRNNGRSHTSNNGCMRVHNEFIISTNIAVILKMFEFVSSQFYHVSDEFNKNMRNKNRSLLKGTTTSNKISSAINKFNFIVKGHKHSLYEETEDSSSTQSISISQSGNGGADKKVRAIEMNKQYSFFLMNYFFALFKCVVELRRKAPLTMLSGTTQNRNGNHGTNMLPINASPIAISPATLGSPDSSYMMSVCSALLHYSASISIKASERWYLLELIKTFSSGDISACELVENAINTPLTQSPKDLSNAQQGDRSEHNEVSATSVSQRTSKRRGNSNSNVLSMPDIAMLVCIVECVKQLATDPSVSSVKESHQERIIPVSINIISRIGQLVTNVLKSYNRTTSIKFTQDQEHEQQGEGQQHKIAVSGSNSVIPRLSQKSNQLTSASVNLLVSVIKWLSGIIKIINRNYIKLSENQTDAKGSASIGKQGNNASKNSNEGEELKAIKLRELININGIKNKDRKDAVKSILLNILKNKSYSGDSVLGGTRIQPELSLNTSIEPDQCSYPIQGRVVNSSIVDAFKKIKGDNVQALPNIGLNNSKPISQISVISGESERLYCEAVLTTTTDGYDESLDTLMPGRDLPVLRTRFINRSDQSVESVQCVLTGTKGVKGSIVNMEGNNGNNTSGAHKTNSKNLRALQDTSILCSEPEIIGGFREVIQRMYAQGLTSDVIETSSTVMGDSNVDGISSYSSNASSSSSNSGSNLSSLASTSSSSTFSRMYQQIFSEPFHIHGCVRYVTVSSADNGGQHVVYNYTRDGCIFEPLDTTLHPEDISQKSNISETIDNSKTKKVSQNSVDKTGETFKNIMRHFNTWHWTLSIPSREDNTIGTTKFNVPPLAPLTSTGEISYNNTSESKLNNGECVVLIGYQLNSEGTDECPSVVITRLGISGIGINESLRIDASSSATLTEFINCVDSSIRK